MIYIVFDARFQHIFVEPSSLIAAVSLHVKE